jgi:hypothetical protein
MSAATITGTTHASETRRVDGAALNRASDRVTVECGRAGLVATVTVGPGAPVEFASVDNQDQVISGWTTFNAGDSFVLTADDGRRMGRAVTPGGSGVRVTFTG